MLSLQNIDGVDSNLTASDVTWRLDRADTLSLILGNFADRYFADSYFADRYFADRHFADEYITEPFRRQDISPRDNPLTEIISIEIILYPVT